MFKFLNNIMNNEKPILNLDVKSIHRILKTDIHREPKNNEDDSEITHLDVVKEHFYDVINDSYKDYVSDIKHYQRFLKLIDIEINEYEKGSKEFQATQYYKFIKKLKKYIKDKILWTAEDDKVSNKLSSS